MTSDVMRERGAVVNSAAQALSSENVNLDTFPLLIIRIVDEEMWKVRAIPQKRWEMSREFSSFEEFVSATPLDGLGASMQALRDLCRHNSQALDAITRACKRDHGGDRRSEDFKNDNVILEPVLSGNSQSYALRKLRKDRPDLHKKVLAGEIKPNAAMEEAGFRKLVRSVRMDDPDSAARTIRKFMTEEARRHLAAKLLE